MWGLLWDRGNLALAGTYGVSRAEVDEMFSLGDWRVIRRGVRPRQLLVVGPMSSDGELRMITCVAELRETPEGPRFRPIIARRSKPSEVARWRQRRGVAED